MTLANWPILVPNGAGLSNVELGTIPGRMKSARIMKQPSLGPFTMGRLREPT